MDHLDAATLEEFQEFNKKFYVPNNAVLVVAGNFEIEETKKMVEDYFGPIPRGNDVPRVNIKEDPFRYFLTISMVLVCYRTPSMKSRDAYVLDMISTILSDGKSSRLYKKMVDEKKISLQVQAVNLGLEDYGGYVIFVTSFR